MWNSIVSVPDHCLFIDFAPTPMTPKIGQLASEIFKFECVDDDGRHNEEDMIHILILILGSIWDNFSNLYN